TDEVRTDISGFRVNAAAESREHADQTSSQSETDQAIDRHLRPDDSLGHAVEDRDREKREANYEQPGDGAAVERHSQCFRDRYGCGLSGAYVGNHCDAHADVPSRKRTKRSDYEPDCRRRAASSSLPRMIFENKQQNKDNHRDGADGDYLTIQIRLGALLHGTRDL